VCTRESFFLKPNAVWHLKQHFADPVNVPSDRDLEMWVQSSRERQLNDRVYGYHSLLITFSDHIQRLKNHVTDIRQSIEVRSNDAASNNLPLPSSIIDAATRIIDFGITGSFSIMQYHPLDDQVDRMQSRDATIVLDGFASLAEAQLQSAESDLILLIQYDTEDKRHPFDSSSLGLESISLFLAKGLAQRSLHDNMGPLALYSNYLSKIVSWDFLVSTQPDLEAIPNAFALPDSNQVAS